MNPCGKKPFKDKAHAVHSLHLIQNNSDGKKKPVRAYECGKCGKWHLTSKTIEEDKPGKYKLKLDWSKLK